MNETIKKRDELVERIDNTIDKLQTIRKELVSCTAHNASVAHIEYLYEQFKQALRK